MCTQSNETIVYKYRPLYIPQEPSSWLLNKHTVNYITNCEIYLARPTEFNDPYDCWIPFDLHCSEEELLREIKTYEIPERLEIEELIRKIGLTKATAEVNSYADSAENLNKQMEETINRMRIHCLSKRFDSLLMWAHYADNHQGVCIGIKAVNDKNIVKLSLSVPDEKGVEKVIEYPLKDVEYAENNKLLPTYRYYGSTNLNLGKYLTYKSKDWAYEEELRLVLWNKDLMEQKIQLKSNSISEVIFGLRTPQEVIKKVIGIAQQQNPFGMDINFFQMQRSTSNFTFEKVKL